MKTNFKISIISENNLESNELCKILSIAFNQNVKISDFLSKSLFNNVNFKVIVINHFKKEKLLSVFDLLKDIDRTNFFLIILDNDNFNVKTQINHMLITPPFSVLNLIEIIKSNFDLKAKSFSLRFKIKNYLYYEGDLKITDTISNKIIKLTEMEDKFISYLIKSKLPVSKAKILENVWGHKSNLETHTLESLVYRLRLKIERNPKEPKIVCLKNKKYFLTI